MDNGHRFDGTGADERLLNGVRFNALSPCSFDGNRFPSASVDDGREPRPEDAVDPYNHGITRLHDIHNRGLHTGRTSPGNGDRETVFCFKDGA